MPTRSPATWFRMGELLTTDPAARHDEWGSASSVVDGVVVIDPAVGPGEVLDTEAAVVVLVVGVQQERDGVLRIGAVQLLGQDGELLRRVQRERSALRATSEGRRRGCSPGCREDHDRGP